MAELLVRWPCIAEALHYSVVYGHPMFSAFPAEYFFSTMADLLEAKANPYDPDLQQRATKRLKKTPGLDEASKFWNSLSFMLFATHDSSPSYLLRYLEGFDGRQPPLASTLFLELWRDPSHPSGHVVKFIYNWKPLQLKVRLSARVRPRQSYHVLEGEGQVFANREPLPDELRDA
ncbi:unnamed protein product [Vitrella brassicaformis CCMP3155]|uniref:Uncharacterized protein n=1 Tax=Vitrella brassicaformis (strain CCMP3155) TaxID=1169540 RepID=A0A0G4F7J1_VITBC|nr:unnamed protein product [Vitrella brassicaformis CCMP3155]|eukprot:CEM07960.1 unnamed protein product [Vitrella brassicaformis CCMP3155]